MPRSHNAALEQAESGFDGIGVNVAVRVLAGVIDRLVHAALQFVQGPRIDSGFVRHNHFDVTANVGVDNLFHGCGLGILGANHSQIAVALTNADDYRLLRSRTPTALLAANVGFVNLYGAAKFVLSRFQHSRANAMAEIPRSFIADLKLALHLVSRHAFARFTEQVGRKEPLPQGQVRIVEDRSSRRAKLVAASIAVKLMTLDNAADLVRLARRAGNALRPAQAFNVGAALGFVAKVFDQGTEVQFAH